MKKTSTLRWIGVSLSLLTLGAAGCAHRSAREIVYVRPGQKLELGQLDMKRQSLVIELRQGEVLPLELVVESDLVAAPVPTSVPLTVKRDCFLRIDDRGLRVSQDGRTFAKEPRAPGTLNLGVAVTEAGKRAIVHVKTPAF